MAKIIMMDVHSDVQQNSGMRIIFMPGQRFLKIVTAMFIPVRVAPIDDSVRAQI